MHKVSIFEYTPEELEVLIGRAVSKAIQYSSTESDPSPEMEIPIQIEEASTFLGVAVPTMYGKVGRREIPYLKRNGRLYFFKSELLDYLKEGRVRSMQQLKDEARISQKSQSHDAQ